MVRLDGLAKQRAGGVAEAEFINLIILSLGLGLLGFIEPCTIGTSLLFIKYMEGKPAAAKIREAAVFMAVRALFIGALGALAALAGTVFLGVQKAGWFLLGSAYVVMGLFYLAGRAGVLTRQLGPSLSRLQGIRGSAGLGLLFGLNIPACAAPLIFALLGAASVGGRGDVAKGFFTLALFGLALSLPLVAALLFRPLQTLLDRLAGLNARLPKWTGALFIVLGLWSLYFAIFVRLEDWSRL